MSGRKPFVVACLCALITVLAGASAPPASAAPRDLYGVVGYSAPYPTAAEFQRIARGGATTVRLGFFWGNVEPTPGLRNWSTLDQVMQDATAAGLTVLPVLFGIPAWTAPPSPTSPPLHTPEVKSAWASFLRDLAARYGSAGSFWGMHPELVPKPLREYQIWNEVNLRYYWGSRPNARAYAELLRISRDGLRQGDPAVRIVGAGLIPFKSVGAGSVPGPRYLERLFKVKGVRGLLDVIAIHPYAKSATLSVKAAEQTRKTLNQLRAKQPLWVTEFGWTTGGGGWDRSPLRASFAEQARRVSQAYRLFAKQAKRLRLQRAYYFAFEDGAGPNWDSQMGLFDNAGQPKPAWFAFVRKAGGQP